MSSIEKEQTLINLVRLITNSKKTGALKANQFEFAGRTKATGERAYISVNLDNQSYDAYIVLASTERAKQSIHEYLIMMDLTERQLDIIEDELVTNGYSKYKGE